MVTCWGYDRSCVTLNSWSFFKDLFLFWILHKPCAEPSHEIRQTTEWGTDVPLAAGSGTLQPACPWYLPSGAAAGGTLGLGQLLLCSSSVGIWSAGRGRRDKSELHWFVSQNTMFATYTLKGCQRAWGLMVLAWARCSFSTTTVPASSFLSNRGITQKGLHG